ncbi:type III pantothenate kinase [Luteolibacter algae]|uniref:Type III pantothenate kinase n=1 Tax=Luteolibacter algae TaxID=454151 RepID=A0ABW5D3I5_9BACT
MAWLLIDNSNNRTKLRLGNSNGLSEQSVVLPTQELSEQSLKTLLEGISFSAVVIASVVPAKAELLKNYFSDSHPCHFLTYRSPLGYGFDLAAPEQIGNDRLANALALKTLYGAPGIAIDFGTAVTFSVIAETGNFAGGVIAPGMSAMTDYLADRTAQLPSVQPSIPNSAIGKTTYEAIQSGAVFGQRGMVREIIHELQRELDGSPKIIATGGGAEFLAKALPEIHLINTDLTLEGIRILAGKIFPEDISSTVLPC